MDFHFFCNYLTCRRRDRSKKDVDVLNIDLLIHFRMPDHLNPKTLQ